MCCALQGLGSFWSAPSSISIFPPSSCLAVQKQLDYPTEWGRYARKEKRIVALVQYTIKAGGSKAILVKRIATSNDFWAEMVTRSIWSEERPN